MKTEYILAGLAVAGIIGYQLYKGKLPSAKTLVASTEDLTPTPVQAAVEKEIITPVRNAINTSPPVVQTRTPIPSIVKVAEPVIINSSTSLVEPIIQPVTTVRTISPIRTVYEPSRSLSTALTRTTTYIKPEVVKALAGFMIF